MTLRIWYGGTGAEALCGTYARAFVRSFGRGERPSLAPHGVYGRVLRGKTHEDFTALSSDPARRLVFLLDEATLADLLGRTGAEVLAQIGYMPDEVRALLAQGTRFRLLVLPRVEAVPATWANVLALAATTYPEWAERLAAARPALETLPYAEIMRQGGVAAEVRAFLERTLHLNPLFAGDGYTRCDGQAVYAEYVCLNRPLITFECWCQIEFPVTLP
ncbi:MAG: hypothetical protein Kow00106_24340 [Anaerolineae bacterium]